MQFAVPQFTDVEDKLIGPLTLKQFLFLLATSGVVLFFWSILDFSFFFFIFALPTVMVGLALAFGKLNGRPIYSYLGAVLSMLTRPQIRVFRREEPNVVIHMKKNEPVVIAAPTNQEAPESRLKKLAYLLDQKTHEENDLMNQGPGTHG